MKYTLQLHNFAGTHEIHCYFTRIRFKSGYYNEQHGSTMGGKEESMKFRNKRLPVKYSEMEWESIRRDIRPA